MALGKDGNLRNSTSFKPYDTSNSFVRKIANRVTGLIGWRPNNCESAVNLSAEELPNVSLSDIEIDSPTPKRIRIQTDADKLRNSQKSNSSDKRNAVHPIGEISTISPSFKNKCIVSSTPASSADYRDKNLPSNAGNTADYSDGNGSSAISPSIPSMGTYQRHNITLPAMRRQESNASTTFDLNRSLNEVSSLMSKRKPSFNAELISSSAKGLSFSLCENRSKSCMSPFYSARTMYGGASALLPYNSQSADRSRTEAAFRVNVFSPKNQITIQPVANPHKVTHDQETMSAAARRILNTLEKYCSPIKDAKRMPINESSMKYGENDGQSKLSTTRGLKRKLPALAQAMPSTTDLLRIKRQEKMQDSVLNARQIVSTVPETLSVTEDNDSSSDSTDLDYHSVFVDDLYENDNNQGRRFVGKMNRKNENKFDDRPLAPLNLPNAMLKITNLPKFNITDTFTFSKPLLLENLDQTVNEEIVPVTNKAGPMNLPAKLTETSIECSESRSLANELSTTLSRSNCNDRMYKQRSIGTHSLYSGNATEAQSNVSNIQRWTCKKCLLDNYGERCSSCSSVYSLHSDINSDLRKNFFASFQSDEKDGCSIGLTENATAIDNHSTGTDPINNGVHWDRDVSFTDSTVTCTNYVEDSKKTSISKSITPNPNDVWKNLQKKTHNTWKCDECWIHNENTCSKCKACGTPNRQSAIVGIEDQNANSKTTLTFGFGKNDVTYSIADSNKMPPNFVFGFTNSKDIAAITSAVTTSVSSSVTVAAVNSSSGGGGGSSSGSSGSSSSSSSSSSNSRSSNNGSTTTAISSNCKISSTTCSSIANAAPVTTAISTATTAFTSISATTTTTTSVAVVAAAATATTTISSPPTSLLSSSAIINLSSNTTATTTTTTSTPAPSFPSSPLSSTHAITTSTTSTVPAFTSNSIGCSSSGNSGYISAMACSTSGSSSTFTSNAQFSFGSGCSSNSSGNNRDDNNINTTTGGQVFNILPSVNSEGESMAKNAFTTTSFTFNMKKTEPCNTTANTSSVFKITPFSSAVTVTDSSKIFGNTENTFIGDVIVSANDEKSTTSKTATLAREHEAAQPSKVASSKVNISYLENGEHSNLPTFSDIISSSDINEKKKISFLSLCNKRDTLNSSSTFGTNGLPENEFKLPLTKNASAVSSSAVSVFPPTFSNILTSTTTADDKLNVNAFSVVQGNSNANVSSQATNSIFGSFSASNHDTNKTTGNSIVVTSIMAAVSYNAVSSVASTSSPFRFGVGTTPQNQNSGGFNFNGPKLDNAVLKFGFGSTAAVGVAATASSSSSSSSTNHNAFGSCTSSPFSFNSTTSTPLPPSVPVEHTPAANSVFSSGLKVPSCDGHISATKSSFSFGNSNVFAAGSAVTTEAFKKSGGFSFSASNSTVTPTANDFANFTVPINDSQDQCRLNTSNANSAVLSSTPFVFGGSENQTAVVQSHNFSTTVPPAFNFTGGNNISSFTPQPASSAPPPNRKFKKAVRRTNK